MKVKGNTIVINKTDLKKMTKFKGMGITFPKGIKKEEIVSVELTNNTKEFISDKGEK